MVLVQLEADDIMNVVWCAILPSLFLIGKLSLLTLSTVFATYVNLVSLRLMLCVGTSFQEMWRLLPLSNEVEQALERRA